MMANINKMQFSLFLNFIELSHIFKYGATIKSFDILIDTHI